MISTIAIVILNHQSIISTIAIVILDHQLTILTIAIVFRITNRELIPLLNDMASHTPGIKRKKLTRCVVYVSVYVTQNHAPHSQIPLTLSSWVPRRTAAG